MKTSIVTALLVVGVLLQAAVVPTINSSLIGTAASQHQATTQATNTVDMNNAVGASLLGCYAFVGQDGNTYGMCCLDLWLFSICFAVNLSALASIF